MYLLDIPRDGQQAYTFFDMEQSADIISLNIHGRWHVDRGNEIYNTHAIQMTSYLAAAICS